MVPCPVGAGGGVEAVWRGSVGIEVCGPYWDSPGIVAEAGDVSSGPLPSQHVLSNEMGPEQEGAPYFEKGSVG